MYYESALTDKERRVLDSFSQIVVWGFPLYTHTHSYIHAMWEKVFSVGYGKKTVWFHDDNFPKDFDFNNSIFITEGYADKNIPVNNTSVYFVHNAIIPEKYLDVGARLIEIRFNVNEIHDVNNDFTLTDGTHEDISYLSTETKYEKITSNKDLHKSKRNNEIKKMNYECIYMYWATDLLPHEFDYNVGKSENPFIYYVASPPECKNYTAFSDICKKNGLKLISVNPWRTPVSFEDNKEMMRHSIICPDFRPTGVEKDTIEFGVKNGKNHMEIGYLPCRVLKAISYGKIGMTDSVHVKKILGEHVLYNPDMEILFQMAMSERNNTAKIVSAMKYVEENHTYVQRGRDMIRAILKK